MEDEDGGGRIEQLTLVLARNLLSANIIDYLERLEDAMLLLSFR